MKPYYEEENITIYNEDSIEIMKEYGNRHFDLCLTDPPFGIGNFVQVSGNIRGKKVIWNNNIPAAGYFEEMKRISEKRIIWGANYFNCFENGGAIVWVKNQPLPNLSKAEVASCNFYKKTEVFNLTWTNFVNTKETKHPCERPVELYERCLYYSMPVVSVIDPFMGSGSTAVACKLQKLIYVGIEISKEYCDIAVKRLAQEVLPL